MRRVLAALLLLAGPAAAQDARMSFWNLTSGTITKLQMAPAGTDAFGPDQCANDRDGSVDHDERLRLTGVAPGRYDVRVTGKAGRTCLARNVEVKAARVAFTLEDKDLADCR